MRRAARLAAVLAACLLALAGPALAAQPQTSLPEIEDEVMCPICGTLLSLSQSPAAIRERAFIRQMIADGATKEEIKDALVAEYGPRVLAEPEGSGFDLSAYLVPIVGFVLAVIGIAVAVVRWRGSRPSGEDSAPPAAPEGEDGRRLDEDLARYDL